MQVYFRRIQQIQNHQDVRSRLETKIVSKARKLKCLAELSYFNVIQTTVLCRSFSYNFLCFNSTSIKNAIPLVGKLFILATEALIKNFDRFIQYGIENCFSVEAGKPIGERKAPERTGKTKFSVLEKYRLGTERLISQRNSFKT